MTSYLESLKPHIRLLTSIELLRQFNTHELRPNLIRNTAVNFDFKTEGGLHFLSNGSKTFLEPKILSIHSQI